MATVADRRALRGVRDHDMGGATVSPIRVVAADDSYMIREFLSTILASASEGLLQREGTHDRDRDRITGRGGDGHSDAAVRRGGGDSDRRPPAGNEPQVGVVVLSAYAEPAYALHLFEKGTGRRAYLLKECLRSREELIGAIVSVARGGSVIDPLVVDVLIQARSRAADSRLSQLTPREREILAEIAAGNSNGAIAESLVLTKRAVEKHVHSIFSKLDLPETQAVSRRVKATLIFLAEEDGRANLG
jgi:DNA-binding CsgD family transcriptional regulator